MIRTCHRDTASGMVTGRTNHKGLFAAGGLDSRAVQNTSCLHSANGKLTRRFSPYRPGTFSIRMFISSGNPLPHSGGRLLSICASLKLKSVTLIHLCPQSGIIWPFSVFPGSVMEFRYGPRAPQELSKVPADTPAGEG